MDSDLDQQFATWMKAAQDGDAKAYEALLTGATTLLRAFIRRRVQQPEWVDDIVQETLISIHEDRHTYNPSRAFSPWMYAIARHRLVDYARKQHRRMKQEQQSGDANLEHAGLEHAGSAAAPASRGNPLERLHRALLSLSSKQRQVIQMLKVDGFSVKEISTRTGMSESSVKVSAHRGYKTLRKLLVSGSDED